MILKSHLNKGRSLVWTRAFVLLLGFHLLGVPDYVLTKAVLDNLRSRLLLAKLNRGRTAYC